MLPDHRDWLRGRDVVARVPIASPRGGIELYLDDLLSARQSVASAHRGDYGRFGSSPRIPPSSHVIDPNQQWASGCVCSNTLGVVLGGIAGTEESSFPENGRHPLRE